MLKYFTYDLYVNDIFEINLQALWDMGKRLILTDLDNTLVESDAAHPTPEVITWLEKAAGFGFVVKIVSNNFSADRVATFAKDLNLEAYDNAKKPLLFNTKRYMKGYTKEETVFMGDQLLTDIVIGRRLGVYTILVKPVKPAADEEITKFNRKLERRIARRLHKKGMPVPPHIKI